MPGTRTEVVGGRSDFAACTVVGVGRTGFEPGELGFVSGFVRTAEVPGRKDRSAECIEGLSGTVKSELAGNAVGIDTVLVGTAVGLGIVLVGTAVVGIAAEFVV